MGLGPAAVKIQEAQAEVQPEIVRGRIWRERLTQPRKGPQPAWLLEPTCSGCQDGESPVSWNILASALCELPPGGGNMGEIQVLQADESEPGQTLPVATSAEGVSPADPVLP